MIDTLPDTRPLSPSLSRENAGRAARELKFVLREELAPVVAAWMRANLEPDPYAAGPHGDAYATTTLYLDTPGLDILGQRHHLGRSKWRVRRYDRGAAIFLERKLRADGLLYKRRTAIRAEDLGLLEESDPGAWSGDWFRRRVARKALRPVCLVSYDRVARLGETREGAVRMTLDTGLRCAAANGLDLDPDCSRPLAEGRAILELKFTDAVPVLFKTLLESLPITPARLSKYRAAGGILFNDTPLTHAASHP